MYLQKQAEAALAQVSQGEVDLKEAREELAEARRQWHGLQVEIESMHALVSIQYCFLLLVN